MRTRNLCIYYVCPLLARLMTDESEEPPFKEVRINGYTGECALKPTKEDGDVFYRLTLREFEGNKRTVFVFGGWARPNLGQFEGAAFIPADPRVGHELRLSPHEVCKPGEKGRDGTELEADLEVQVIFGPAEPSLELPERHAGDEIPFGGCEATLAAHRVERGPGHTCTSACNERLALANPRSRFDEAAI